MKKDKQVGREEEQSMEVSEVSPSQTIQNLGNGNLQQCRHRQMSGGISFIDIPNFADSNRSNPFPPSLIIYPPGTCISVNNTEEKSMKTLS